MTKKSKMFWIWVAAEAAIAGWIGWQIAHATEQPWARGPKAKPTTR